MKQIYNPYLPEWEYIPDGEPHVFGDRVYLYGSHDRFYPSSKKCSCCGKVKEELKLSERIYRCSCGLEMDRDINAAVNIREEGRRILTA